MNQNLIQEFSNKIEEAKQEMTAVFKNKVERECQQVASQSVNDVQVAELKKAYLEQLRQNADNQLQIEFLDFLDKKEMYYQLSRTFFSQDTHLISLIDNEKLSSDFNAKTQDFIILPSAKVVPIPTSLLSKQKFRYYLVPFVSIVLAVALFMAISFTGGFFAK